MQILKAVKKRLGRPYRWLVRDRKTLVWILEGEQRSDGTPVRILYIGESRNREYLRRMVFGDKGTQTFKGSVAKSRLHVAWRKHATDVDLVIIKTPQAVEALVDQAFFVIPVWIDALHDIDKVPALLKNSKELKKELRRIRKHRFTYKVVSDPASFDHFYHHMYLPYILSRHGEAAMPITYEQMQKNVSRSELLLIMQNGEALGGVMLVYGEREVHSWKTGIRNGDAALTKQSVAAATYVFEAQYLSDKGLKLMNLGGTRTFLRDGQFSFKKKWGITLGRSWDQYFYTKAMRPSHGARAFLAQNPFLHMVDGEYYGAAFIADAAQITEKALSKLIKECRVDGMRELTLYCLEGDPQMLDAASLGTDVQASSDNALWPTDGPSA